MAAASPIQPHSSKQAGSGSPLLAVLRIAILLILGGGSVYLLIVHREWFADPRMVKKEVLECGAWGPIAYILLYAVGPSFLVPGAVMTLAAGLAFGAVRGALWSVIGANIGALVAFGAGRFLGRDFVERTIGHRFHTLLSRLARNGFYITLYLRIVPVIPYNAFNLLAGASPIVFRDYFWASVIGMIPGTILFAVLGDALWHPTSPRFFVALALIMLCFAGGEFYRRRKAIVLDVEPAA
jgi:uncharacterized membrane protein YdjX (TVP38/TMEM64 family)